MTSSRTGWALTAASFGLAASVAGATLFLDMPLSNKAVASTAPAEAPATPVTVTVIKARNIDTWQEFSGRLEAVDRVQIRSRVAGAVQSVDFREGALVKTGDLLFTIDPAPYQAAVAQAQGLLASAKARANLAEIELARGKKLAPNSAISQSDLDQRQNAVSEAQAGVQTAEAALHAAELELSYTEVRAPVSGRVGRVEVTVGNLVAAGSASSELTTLVSVDPIYASFSVAEEVVGKALAALPASDAAVPPIEAIPVEIGTLADEGTPIEGKLQLIGNEVDAASGTIDVRAVFGNPGGRLIPGQFVRIRMGEPKAEPRILISEKAIGTDQDKKFVFVVDADNKITYRPVTLGQAVEGARIVESGLNEGDRVVVSGLQRIRPGVVVAPQTEQVVAGN